MSQHNLKTLVQVLDDLKQQGYTVDFNFEDGKLHALNNQGSFSADEVKITEEFRFEGDTNPADESILYAIEAGPLKGTLIDSYGAKSDDSLERFIKKADRLTDQS